MKICVISTLFSPYSRGGAELVAQRVAAGFLGRGDEVVIITARPFKGLRSLWPHPSPFTLSPEGRGKKEEAPSRHAEEGVNPNPRLSLHGRGLPAGRVRVFRFFPLNICSFLNLGKLPAPLRLVWHLIDMFNLHTFFAVRAILKKERPNLVLSHNIKGLGYLAPLAIRSTGIRHAHTVHDVQLVEPSGLIFPTPPTPPLRKGRKGGVLYAWLCKKLFSSPTMVISPSKWLLDFYTSYGFFQNSKKAVIPNPVIFKEWTSHEGPHEVPHEEKEEHCASLQLLYISQLEPSRGILFLVKILKQWDKNFHLTIVGAGSCEKLLYEELKNDLRFTLPGYVKNEKLGSFYAEADALILPSLCLENAPLTITGSFAHGVPVIASRAGGIPEMVHEGKTGFVFEPGNTKNLLEKLDKFWEIKTQGRLPRLQENTRAWIQDKTISHYLGKSLQAAL